MHIKPMRLQTPETKRQRAAAHISPERAAQPAAESAGGPSAMDQPMPAAAAPSIAMMASPATSTMELTGLQLLSRCIRLWVHQAVGAAFVAGSFRGFARLAPAVRADVHALQATLGPSHGKRRPLPA